jgi:hypothetical protein
MSPVTPIVRVSPTFVKLLIVIRPQLIVNPDLVLHHCYLDLNKLSVSSEEQPLCIRFLSICTTHKNALECDLHMSLA